MFIVAERSFGAVIGALAIAAIANVAAALLLWYSAFRADCVAWLKNTI